MSERAGGEGAGRAIARQIVPPIIFLLWLLAAIETLTDWRLAISIAGILALILSLWAAATRSGYPRFAVLVFGGAGALMLARSEAWMVGLGALENASRFVAFLGCLHLLRAIVQSSPSLRTVQDSFIAFRPQAKRGALQLLGMLFSLPLAIGAISVIAPFVAREPDPEVRLDAAAWAMRGLSFAVFFSPFTVAMGIVGASLPGLDLPLLMGLGCLLSLVVLAIPHLIGQARLPRSLPASFWQALWAVLMPVFLIVVANITVIFGGGLSTVQAAILVVPVFAVAVALISPLLVPAAKGRGRAMAGMIRQTVGSFDNEIAVFVSALVFAAGVTATPEINAMSQQLVAALGPPAMIVATLLGIALFSSLGVHMVVPTTVLLTLFGPSMPDALHLALLALAGLLGWTFGTMSAMGSIAFLICANLFGVSARRLAFGQNLRFMLMLFAAYSAAILLLL